MDYQDIKGINRQKLEKITVEILAALCHFSLQLKLVL